MNGWTNSKEAIQMLLMRSGHVKNGNDETESKLNIKRLKTQPKHFYFHGITKHVNHSTKCIEKHNNVEKQHFKLLRIAFKCLLNFLHDTNNNCIIG